MAVRPLPESCQVTQTFKQDLTGYNLGAAHGAVDFAAKEGTPVVAPEDGIIRFADWAWNLPGGPDDWQMRKFQIKPAVGDKNSGGGIMTFLENSIGSTWIFAHLSDNDMVKSGMQVKAGQIIGLSGNTGSSTGPHLHVSLLPPFPDYNNGYFGGIDPAPFFTEKYFVLGTPTPQATETPSMAKQYKFETKWTTKNQVARSFYGNYGPKPVGVTIHHWGELGQNFDNVCHFLSTNNVPTSAHYVVEDGRIACLASPEAATFHAGHAVGNGTTVGIEMRPECTAGDVDTLVQLIYELEKTYGGLNVYEHKDWFNTACPGKYSAKIPEIIKRVNTMHINGGKDPELSTSVSVSSTTYTVKGAIGRKYTAIGGAKAIGYPTMNEKGGLVDGGYYQEFDLNGKKFSIYWSPATGAHVVKHNGAIGSKWISAGREKGYGYPTSDEQNPSSGYWFQKFSKNTLHWTKERGIWIT